MLKRSEGELDYCAVSQNQPSFGNTVSGLMPGILTRDEAIKNFKVYRLSAIFLYEGKVIARLVDHAISINQ